MIQCLKNNLILGVCPQNLLGWIILSGDDTEGIFVITEAYVTTFINKIFLIQWSYLFNWDFTGTVKDVIYMLYPIVTYEAMKFFVQK